LSLLNEEKVHKIYYRSIDNAANAEDQKELTVNVDNSPPTASLQVSGPKYEVGDGDETMTFVSPSSFVSIIASDGGKIPCGISYIEYQIDAEVWHAYSGLFATPAQGQHYIKFIEF